MNWFVSMYLWLFTDMDIKDHRHFKIHGLSDRYLPPQRLEQVLTKLNEEVRCRTVGESVGQRPIYAIELGKGPVRVLIWSQMHGNESTTTRALLDFLMAYAKDAQIKERLSRLSICILPMLNPDGALAYTRENANEIDLNRDAGARSEPETRVLFSVFETFKPHYCFNLHDQRTRYGVGEPPVSANLSFLAPAADAEKSVTTARETAMKLIAHLTNKLQREYQVDVGRYDDEFNPDCVGDTFTKMGIPCILFESGFFPGDYSREKTRMYMYYALLLALDGIADIENLPESTGIYFEIPENKTCFADIILRNVVSSKTNTAEDIILNYEEELVNGVIEFIPALLSEEYAQTYHGHRVYDLSKKSDTDHILSDPDLRKFIE